MPSWPPRLADFGLGIAIQWALMAAMYATFLLPFGKITYQGWNLDIVSTLPLLLATLIGLFIQTGFEELYFRGLLQQATRRIAKCAPRHSGCANELRDKRCRRTRSKV